MMVLIFKQIADHRNRKARKSTWRNAPWRSKCMQRLPIGFPSKFAICSRLTGCS